MVPNLINVGLWVVGGGIVAGIVIDAVLRVLMSRNSHNRIADRASAADFARNLLRFYGVTGVKIERKESPGNNNYNMKKRTLNLTRPEDNSLAGVAIALHEAAHAVQHEKRYLSFIMRNAGVTVSYVLSQLSFPLILAGLLFYKPVSFVGLCLYFTAMGLALLNLPVEGQASLIGWRFLNKEERVKLDRVTGVGSLLCVAGLTYLPSIFMTTLSLIRKIFLPGW